MDFILLCGIGIIFIGGTIGAIFHYRETKEFKEQQRAINRWTAPHLLMFASFLLSYLLLFLPSLVVVNEPLSHPKAEESVPKIQLGEERKAYFWHQNEIDEVDQCLFIVAQWPSEMMRSFFLIWKYTNLAVIIISTIYWNDYLNKYPFPAHVFLFAALFFAITPIIVMVTFFNDYVPYWRCSPEPVILIKRIYPFWPWIFIFAISLLCGRRASQQLFEETSP